LRSKEKLKEAIDEFEEVRWRHIAQIVRKSEVGYRKVAKRMGQSL